MRLPRPIWRTCRRSTAAPSYPRLSPTDTRQPAWARNEAEVNWESTQQSEAAFSASAWVIPQTRTASTRRQVLNTMTPRIPMRPWTLMATKMTTAPSAI